MKIAVATSVAVVLLGLVGPAQAVTVKTGTVNGVTANIWTWTDSTGLPRTVALRVQDQMTGVIGRAILAFV